MEEWKESIIEDTSIQMIDGDRGKNYPKNSDFFSQGYCLFLNAGNVTKTGFSFSENSFITENKDRMLRKGRLERNDVVITTRGTVGNVALYDSSVPYEHLRINSGMLILKGGRDILPEYLYYFLKGKRFQAQLSLYVSGTAQPQLPKSTLGKMMISFPVELNVQKKVCGILKSLDDKIAVNKKICENLETQAQALFKHWFVDFAPFKNGKFVESELGLIPEALIYKRIEDMPHTLETGKRPSGGVKGIDSGIPSIGAENIKGLGCYDFSKTKYVTKEYASTMKKGIINGYELLIYKDGGKPGYFIPNFAIFGEGYPYEKMCLNEHVFKLDFGNKGYSLFSYFFFKTKQIMSYLNAQGAKAAIPGINSKDIDAIMMPSLDNECVKQYCSEVEDIITQILVLSKESAKLATLRDALLPKLMSGQIKV
jgi:type I restriction enzyme S subunit